MPPQNEGGAPSFDPRCPLREEACGTAAVFKSLYGKLWDLLQPRDIVSSRGLASIPGFYDALARLYHQVHHDGLTRVRRPGARLSARVQAEWPAHRCVLDGSCGIGTQAMGWALHGFAVTGFDVSAGSIERARHEAGQWVQVNHEGTGEHGDLRG